MSVAPGEVSEFEQFKQLYGLPDGTSREVFDALSHKEKNQIAWCACLEAPHDSALGQAFNRWLDRHAENPAIDAYEDTDEPLEDLTQCSTPVARHAAAGAPELTDIIGNWIAAWVDDATRTAGIAERAG